MQSYDELIRLELDGETPREKYEYLMRVKGLLRAVAYPRRGTFEERWDVVAFAAQCAPLIDQHGKYIEPTEANE